MSDKINYSLDMIRIQFELEKNDVQYLYDKYSMDTRVEHWERYKYKEFKHQFKFICDDNNTFWIGSEPNWSKRSIGDWVSMVLEFNPNKVGDDLTLVEVYGSLMTLCRDLKCLRYDLAIDMPVERSRCVLMKDRRKYKEERHSDTNLTQYLGVAHSNGYTKLYNKAIELGLKENKLTRLEITVHYEDRNSVEFVFPRVCMIDKIGLGELTGTDKALIYGALLDMNILNFLDKRKKKKIKDILTDESLILEFDPKKYLTVLSLVESYINKSMFIKGL